MHSQHKYFPVNAAQKEWGLYATCVGHTRSEPSATFPSREHPDEYYFTWDRGRILHEWQLIFIEGGSGTVEFKQKKFRAQAGALVVIPPECWHRYRPNPKTGWKTLWMGFGGDLAARLVGGALFSPDGDMRRLPPRHSFHRLFANTVENILMNGHDNVYAAAAQIPMLVAALVEDRPPDESRASSAELVHRAQMYIKEHATETIDFEKLAESLGLTYRTFRYLISKETSSSPLQYQLGVRLARAKNLLKSSDMPISEIAETLGFNSTWYFSHFFRKHARTSAADYRDARSPRH